MSRGLEQLKTHLPAASWTDDQDIIAPHLTEWRDLYFGQTPLMLMPDSPEQTSQIVQICAAHDLKIVPQGGNTGLVGGQTPQGEILLSTKRLRNIRDVNPITNCLVAESGVTLHSVHEAAENADRKFPLFLASQGTCTIGGNLSTNAGGNHVLKYGTTKDLVFGVEAVLPNGEIFNGLTSLRKDNTGYDLSRLFLGAEGTLGIITAASLKLFPKAGYIQRVIMGTDSPASALTLLDHCRVGQALSMFEVIPQIGMDLVVQNIEGQRDPFSEKHPWYVLVDWEVGDAAMGRSIAEEKLSDALDRGLIRDAVIAQSETQASEILSLRENMSAGQKFAGGSIKFDVTLPLNHIPAFLEQGGRAVQKIVPGARPVAFGHLGDGNIHYNIAQPATDNIADEKDAFLANTERVTDVVFDLIDQFGGSISAEHGIGIQKKNDLARRADPVKLSLLRTIKKAIDPHNIMNPRVML